MKILFKATFIIFSLFLFQTVQASSLKISKKTAGELERSLKEGEGKSKSLLEQRLSEILIEDSAIKTFGESIVDLCLNPKKYDFPDGDEERNCSSEELQAKVLNDLAFNIIEKHSVKANAIHIERSLNEFMNTYIDRYRDLVKAFSEWNGSL